MQCFVLSLSQGQGTFQGPLKYLDESFWTQKQSCITQKVGLEKWWLFFVFVYSTLNTFRSYGETKNIELESIAKSHS